MSAPHAAQAAPGGVGAWRRLAGEYAKVQLVYNPLITGVAVLALSEGPLTHTFALSLTIAAVASTVSFAPVTLAVGLDRLRQRHGRAPAAHGHAWYFALALLTMPLGLYLAAAVTERVFGVRAPGSAADYRFGAFIGTLIAAALFGLQTRADARAAAVSAALRAERAERIELGAQLAALRAQLDPHLLFNALNTVAALIPIDAAAAERTLLRLAELYRGLLAASRSDLHSLEHELEICRAYLDVERARFGERLAAEIEIAPELDPARVEVPVLILQPLVENAITHGLAGRARGGALWVRVQLSDGLLTLVVQDDGVGLGGSSRRGAGLALETTRQRLRLRYGDAATLELAAAPGGGTRALLRLPQATMPSAEAAMTGGEARDVLTSACPGAGRAALFHR